MTHNSMFGTCAKLQDSCIRAQHSTSWSTLKPRRMECRMTAFICDSAQIDWMQTQFPLSCHDLHFVQRSASVRIKRRRIIRKPHNRSRSAPSNGVLTQNETAGQTNLHIVDDKSVQIQTRTTRANETLTTPIYIHKHTTRHTGLM